MKPEMHIFRDSGEMATFLAEKLLEFILLSSKKNQKVNIALSGGNTPELFYRRLSSLAAVKSPKINWEPVHFFWGDERCVPPGHAESNFGMANRALLRTIEIPEKNIHRIYGENKPEEEAIRYSSELRLNLPLRNGTPRFDWIFLGLGEDGHTASIFPDRLDLLYSVKECEVAHHPTSGQKRITVTGKVLINASNISFLVTGGAKKIKVMEILKDYINAKKYPAYFIKPVSGELEWLLDFAAAELIK